MRCPHDVIILTLYIWFVDSTVGSTVDTLESVCEKHSAVITI